MITTIRLGNLNGHTGGSFHGMVYDSDGLAPTLNSMQGGGTQPMIVELKRFGNIYGEEFGTGYAGNVWDKEGLCPTIKVEGAGGNRQPMIIEDNDPVIVASRGRNPENPSDRRAGIHLEQRYEVNDSGCSNTLTSVEKDNYVLEIKDELAMESVKIEKIGSVYNDGSQCGTVIKDSGLASTISAGTHGYCNPHIAQKIRAIDEQNMTIRDETWGTVMTDGSSPKHNNRVWELEKGMGYRIRKLTPRECGRLMDVSDEDIDKMEAVMSKTQLYKQFGNSIVCNVLVAIFGQLFEGKEEIYKNNC